MTTGGHHFHTENHAILDDELDKISLLWINSLNQVYIAEIHAQQHST